MNQLFGKMKKFLAGIGVGAFNSIPGVGGGTILVLLGMFEPFMGALDGVIQKENKHRFQDIWFVGQIIIGAVVGILLASILLKPLLWYAYIPLMFLFSGIILVGCYFIYQHEVKSKKDIKWISLLIGVLVVLVPYLLSTPEVGTNPIIPELSLMLVITMLGVGLIGGVAMILPGISGSMILILLGYYYLIYQGYVLAVLDFNLSFTILIPLGVFAIGIVLGIFFGGKLCTLAFVKAPKHSYSAIIGLLLGSAISIIPMKSEQFANFEYDEVGNVIRSITYQYDLPTILFSILAFVVGGLAIYLFETKINKIEQH